jgi:PAS domain S-box-containing protein
MAPLEIKPQAEIGEPLRFETLLAEISTFFINLPADRIDSEIKVAQRRVCELLDLDRSSLFQVHERDPGTLLLTHFYQPAGSRIPPERMSLKELFPWVLPKVLGGETITISKMTDLPAEAGRDRETFDLYGTRSTVIAPLAVGGRGVFGLLSFAVMQEEREWTETVVKDFQLIAHVFANALVRKSTEESLQQKTEELDQFFSVTLDLLCIANTEGYFLRLNPAWERVLGYSREELTAGRFLDFVHPDDLAGTREAVSRLASQREVIHFENRYRCKDGTYRWLEWLAAPAGELIYAAARDATLRKQEEEALRERLQFEHLLSGLSARFVNMPADQVDSEIEDGLKQILEFFQVDRCGLLRLLLDKTAFQITHVASSDDVPPVPEGVELPRSLYPWTYEKLTENNEALSVSRLDDLPADANVDRQTCIEWGIRSYVNIPIMIGESVEHIININSVKSERVWPEELFPRLRLLGEIFVNALLRKQAEEAARESERKLRQNESDLRGLAGRLIYAQEEERSRLARELHDDLTQRLAVVAIDVGRLELQLTDPTTPVREALQEMKSGIVRISQDVHNLSRQLHPSILDDLGLIKAVESECASFSKREGIEVVFNHQNIPRVIPKDVSLSLYRIIQEGLRNISKHACAQHTAVSLQGIDHDVLLSVQDDGIGIDWAEVKENPGLGFSSMRERARLIHGEFFIESQIEKGTVITVKAPLTREGE